MRGKERRPIHTRFTTRASCATRGREQASFSSIGANAQNLSPSATLMAPLLVQVKLRRPAVLRHDQIDRAVVINVHRGATSLLAIHQQTAFLPGNRAKTAPSVSLQQQTSTRAHTRHLVI